MSKLKKIKKIFKKTNGAKAIIAIDVNADKDYISRIMNEVLLPKFDDPLTIIYDSEANDGVDNFLMNIDRDNLVILRAS